MPSRNPKLGLESLETRENPAVIMPTGGQILIVTTEATGSDVSISRGWKDAENDNLVITDELTGKSTKLVVDADYHPAIIFYGGTGNDKLDAKYSLDPVTAYGYDGNDTLIGGVRGDRLDGGNHNDQLFGNGDNDTIYGRAGYDFIDGGWGNDFLDGGNPEGAWLVGGEGYDFIAQIPVKNGTVATDVDQTQTPTCWILAPLAAAAKAGINLEGRITYMGDGEYRVKMMNANGTSSYEYVSLEGGMLSFEPTPKDEESWVIIYQRAIMQRLGQDWTKLSGYSSGWPSSVMSFLTGRPVSNYGNQWGGGAFDTANDGEMVSMKQQLDAGKIVCANTRKGGFGSYHILGSVSTPKLVPGHCYAVHSIDLDNKKITLRNPWGTDIGNGTVATQASGDPSDGLVTISFNEFYNSMWSYSAS